MQSHKANAYQRQKSDPSPGKRSYVQVIGEMELWRQDKHS